MNNTKDGNSRQSDVVLGSVISMTPDNRICRVVRFVNKCGLLCLEIQLHFERVGPSIYIIE